jgi:hypothetical protein
MMFPHPPNANYRYFESHNIPLLRLVKVLGKSSLLRTARILRAKFVVSKGFSE